MRAVKGYILKVGYCNPSGVASDIISISFVIPLLAVTPIFGALFSYLLEGKRYEVG